MKTLGLFDMRVNLHPEVAVEIKVNIARSDDEAAEQLRLGRAIISDIAEREREEAAEAARAAADRIAAQEAEEEDTTNADAGEDTAEAAGKPKLLKKATPKRQLPPRQIRLKTKRHNRASPLSPLSTGWVA